MSLRKEFQRAVWVSVDAALEYIAEIARNDIGMCPNVMISVAKLVPLDPPNSVIIFAIPKHNLVMVAKI